MPLLDHFHDPWKTQRPWEGFHSTWASSLAQRLNHGWLPAGYFAMPTVRLGGHLEIDVAALEETPSAAAEAIRAVIDFADSDQFEVQIYAEQETPRLVAAIELVSPANKDRAGHREAFVNKCANYLRQGAGVLLVDVVTSRHTNLHEQLLEFFHMETENGKRSEDIYSAAYRTLESGEDVQLDAWCEPLTLNANLPTMPLWLDSAVCVPVDLEESYMAARETLLM